MTDYLTLTTNQKINAVDKYIESINSRNPAQEQRIPTKSSDLLKTIYNLSPAELGEKARDVTELQPPETQGKNALALAEHIIQKGETFRPDKPLLYRRAVFFKQLYDSNTCYICGYPIDNTLPHAEELEHVLPIAEALALTAIIQLKGKEFKRNLDEISNSTDAYLYLLEYARAHTCCNQVKGVVSFLSFNGTPPYKEPYKIDNNSISQVLKNIWINFGHGGKLQQFEHACANRKLIESYFSKISLSKFVEERKSIIIRDFMNPILDEIKNFVGTNGLQFSQLCYIANQALSIDQNIWGHLGSRWRGDEINLSDLKGMIIGKIVTNTRSSYDNTIGSVIDEILKIYNSKTNLELNSKINEHFTKQLAAERARPIRTLDKPTFSRIINIEYSSFFDIHIRYLTARNNQEILAYTRYPFIFFGIEYIFYLLNSQKSDFKFNTAMIDPLIEMIYNVNKYTIYYIFLYFIIYNPFINKTTFDSPDNASTVVLDKLNQNIYTPYEEIQLNFVNNVFDNFNFLSDISSVFKLDLQILTNYGSYITTSPTTIIAAETLASIFYDTKTRLNSELTAIESQPPAGGKKHKKNKTKKHKKSKRKSNGRTIKRRKPTK